MKKKFLSIVIFAILAGSIGLVLARNKSKINQAAHPEKVIPVVPVKVFEVKTDSFSTAFTINGTTVPDHEVKIASEVQGKLIRLNIKNGDQVHTGQVLAVLDPSVLQVQLTSIEASIAKANLDLSRYTKLVSLGGATLMQIEAVQLQINSLQAEKKQVLDQIEHMQIRAPFNGKMENVKVELGSFVSYGTILAELIDNSSLKIDIYLSEQEALKVKRGQIVTISSVAMNKTKSGKINMISDKADESGKFLAEIRFSNSDDEILKAGILADVYFSLDTHETGLSVPVSALIGSAHNAKVFVVKENHVEQRNIKTGIVTSDKLQVTEGLKAGEQVVISGQLNLENGSPISINK